MKNNLGFTLVEILLVIAIIGILAGVTISVMNPNAAKNRSTDGVKQANMDKLVQALESYNAAEGKYPQDTNADGMLTTTDGQAVTTYIASWPTEFVYDELSSQQDFLLYVPSSATTGMYYKYHTDVGQIQFCGNNTGTTCPSTPSAPALPPSPDDPPEDSR